MLSVVGSNPAACSPDKMSPDLKGAAVNALFTVVNDTIYSSKRQKFLQHGFDGERAGEEGVPTAHIFAITRRWKCTGISQGLGEELSVRPQHPEGRAVCPC